MVNRLLFKFSLRCLTKRDRVEEALFSTAFCAVFLRCRSWRCCRPSSRLPRSPGHRWSGQARFFPATVIGWMSLSEEFGQLGGALYSHKIHRKITLPPFSVSSLYMAVAMALAPSSPRLIFGRRKTAGAGGIGVAGYGCSLRSAAGWRPPRRPVVLVAHVAVSSPLFRSVGADSAIFFAHLRRYRLDVLYGAVVKFITKAGA